MIARRARRDGRQNAGDVRGFNYVMLFTKFDELAFVRSECLQQQGYFSVRQRSLRRLERLASILVIFLSPLSHGHPHQ